MTGLHTPQGCPSPYARASLATHSCQSPPVRLRLPKLRRRSGACRAGHPIRSDWVPKQEGPDVPARGLSFRREGSPYPSGIYGPGPGNTTSSLRTRIYQTGGEVSRPVGLTKRCGIAEEGGWVMARALRPAHSCPPVRKEVGWAAARALRPARARPLSFETPQRPVAHERGRVWDEKPGACPRETLVSHRAQCQRVSNALRA